MAIHKFQIFESASSMVTLVLCLATHAVAAASAPAPAIDGARADDCLAYVAIQTARSVGLHANISTYPDKVMHANSTAGLHEWKLAHVPGQWTNGFWPGLMWNLNFAEDQGDWATLAEKWTAGLAPNQFNNRTHDVGFMVYYSFGLGYQQNPSLRANYGPIIFNTAKSLASRFNPKVGCTMSWSPGKHCNKRSIHVDEECEFTVIIDNMMNLEVLFFAALNVTDEHCGNCTKADREHLLHIATSHANTTALNHIRSDGSTHHIVDYDPNTGAVKFACAGGGYNDTSTWARGQAWAIYSFTMCYRYTGMEFYLETAVKVANYMQQQLKVATRPTIAADKIPAYDLADIPEVSTNLSQRDASAAAIAASGLIELSTFVSSSGSAGAGYFELAKAMLHSLGDKAGDFRSDFDSTEGALLHCNAEDSDVPWADYYLSEACLRLRKQQSLSKMSG